LILQERDNVVANDTEKIYSARISILKAEPVDFARISNIRFTYFKTKNKPYEEISYF